MRPSIIAWLEARGLSDFAGLVPTPGVVYSLMIAALVALFLVRSRSRGINWRRGLDVAVCAGVGAWIGTHLFPVLVAGDALRVSPWEWLSGSRGTAS